MNILKLKKNANECTWVPADKVEFINVAHGAYFEIMFLGTGDDLAYDEVRVTGTDPQRAAAVVAAHIHQSATSKGGIIDVIAIPSVSAITTISAA